MISVLYVDDEPDLLEIGKLFLERDRQFSVATRISAIKGLEALKETAFDAIISDFQMPEINGIDFLKMVRASGNTIPFIVFTGRGREEIVIQALNEGADFYLQKGGEPVSQFTELAHKIRKAVMQRRAEATIHDHERREADIINFLPDATFAIDTEGVVIAWNRAMEKMTGVRADAVLKKGNYEYALPFYHERRPILIDLVLHDDPVTAAKYPAIKREDKNLFSEITIPHFNNGKGASLWFTASPLYDTKGNVVGAIESIREITERKQAEEALRDSEERYRNVVEDQTEFISRFLPDGTHVFVNDAYCRYFGLSRDGILGHRFRPEIPVEDRQQVRRFFESLTPDHPIDTIEHRIIMPGGSMRWQRWSDRAIFDDFGTIVEYQSVGRDVTERREMEESLRQTNIVVENSPVVIFRWKAEEGWPVANVSENVTRFGYTPEELLSGTVSYSAMICPEDLERVTDEVARYSRDGIDRFRQEYRILTKGGRVRWVDDRTVIEREPDGRITHYQGILIDSTDQKRAEAALVDAYREFNDILNQMQDVFYRTDAEGRLTRLSRSMSVLLGYDDTSDLIGKSIAEELYFKPADRQEFLRAVTRDGKVTNYEICLKRKDGSPVLISANSHFWHNADGTVGGIEGTFRDITEQKKIEAALRESEEKYRSLSEASRDLIFVIDDSDRITYTNRSAAEKMGVPAERLVGAARSTIFPPDGSERQRKAIRTVFGTGQPLHSTGKLRFGGEEFWFDHELVPIRDPAGNVVRVLGISRDITELKKTEELLRQKTEELDYRTRVISTILDTVPIGILMTEAPSGKTIIANPTATRLLGSGIIPDAKYESIDEAFRIYRAGTDSRYPVEELPIIRGMRGESHHCDDVVVGRPDGTRIQLEMFGTPVKDRKGRISASLVSFLDITERKRAEEELQVVQEKYSKAFLSIPDAITISELDTGKFIEVNDAATELFGFSREELIGKSASELGIWLSEEDRKAFFDQLMIQGRVHEFETTERRKNGDLYHALINADTLTIQGRKYLIAILRDITDRKRAEQVIREANRKINLLTSITRHDVANQVSILKGYAQIAQNMKPAPVVGDLLNKIDAAGSTIARQVEFTRTYQDLGMQAPGWYSVGELVAKQKSGDVRVICTCNAEIYADPMLERVFFNLIDNAVRHGERVTDISVTCGKTPAGFVLSVADNGIGVPEDLKEKIFEKGFGKNTGFGLFLAEEILAITGMTIREAGTEGDGARFDITVPEGVYRIRSNTTRGMREPEIKDVR